MEKHLLVYNNLKVGWIKISQTDMWYWDCIYENEEKIGSKFLKLIKNLIVVDTFQDLSKAIPAEVHFEGDSNKVSNVLVLGFIDSILVLRTIA